MSDDALFVIRPLTALVVPILREIPGLLPEDPPEPVGQRLFPEPTSGDAKLNRDWSRMVVPELKALLLSARQLVAEDLRVHLRPEDKKGTAFRLEIPANHLHAWIAALNAARLSLGARHEIEDGDMEGDEEEDGDDEDADPERSEAIWKIHFLGSIQALLIEQITY